MIVLSDTHSLLAIDYSLFTSHTPFYLYGMGFLRNASTSAVFAKLVNPLLCFVLIVFVLYIGQGILVPFAFSCLLAVLLTSPSRRLEKWGLPRGLAALVCLLLAVVVFVVVFYFISSSVISFRKDIPQMLQNLQQAILDIELWLQKKFNLSTEKVHELVQSSTSDVLPKTSVLVNTALSTVSGAFFTGVIVFLQAFLLLLYRSLIIRFFVSLLAEAYSSHVYNIAGRIKYVIRSYILGLFIEMLAVAAAYCGALFIIGAKYALLLGIIGALLNLIPYLGIFVACALTALITFTTNPSAVLWSVVSILVIHLVDSNVLLPKIVGSKVKLNALATIMGVIIGHVVWGIPGMFLAVPTMAILKVLFEDITPFNPLAILMSDEEEVVPANPVIKQVVKAITKKKASGRSGPPGA